MRKVIHVGSRKSKLALAQTKWVIEHLKKEVPHIRFEIVELSTKGDRILDVTLSKIGGKGLFVSEVEDAITQGRIDFAVHSMKDMPTVLAPGLIISSIPIRENPYDCLLFKENYSLNTLPKGAVIGTSSARRQLQLTRLRPDLIIEPIRGNIDTRLKKLETENFDGIILAVAGLNRLNWQQEKQLNIDYLDEKICVPAVGQGALAIECRENDTELRQLLATLNDPVTATCVAAERSFLKTLDGGCDMPIGGFAQMNDKGIIELIGIASDPSFKTYFYVKLNGVDPLQLGIEAGQALLKQGLRKYWNR